MVWTAIGRPLYDSKTGECIFDGKVHMETITHWHKLKRGKRKGQKVIRNVKVDGKKAREMIRNTYAAIVEKFPTAYRRRKIGSRWTMPAHTWQRRRGESARGCTRST